MFVFHLKVYSTMVLWFTIMFYVFFSFIVHKKVRMETFNKISTFIHLYRVLSFVSSVAHVRGLNNLTHLHWGLAEASPFLGVFTMVPR